MLKAISPHFPCSLFRMDLISEVQEMNGTWLLAAVFLLGRCLIASILPYSRAEEPSEKLTLPLETENGV
jgi:hypothetical protein